MKSINPIRIFINSRGEVMSLKDMQNEFKTQEDRRIDKNKVIRRINLKPVS